MDESRTENSIKNDAGKKFEKRKRMNKCGGVIFTKHKPDIRMLRPIRSRRRRCRKQGDKSEIIADVKNF
jgi:hypothetical protein